MPSLRKIPILNLHQLITVIEKNTTVYVDDDVFTPNELSTFTIDRLTRLLKNSPYYMVPSND